MGESVLTRAYARAGGTLHCVGVPLDILADHVGTPAYVYSSATIREQYAALEAALAGIPHRVHYACKANGNLAILAQLRALGAGIDVVSGGEMYRARIAGFAPEDIVFGGVGKAPREIDEALASGIALLSVESEGELQLVDALARARGVVARVGIRVNPEITVESVHDYIKTGQKGDKFGVPHDQAERIALLAHRAENVRLVAIGMHIGSQLTQIEAYAAGLARLESLIAALRASGVHTLEHVDIGGGLFVPYDDESPADLEAFARLVSAAVSRLGLSLIIEPGRFLVADSGVLLTRVLYRKRSGGRELMITDAGMNDLLRPSHYQAFHRIVSVHPTEERARFDVMGPICESGDFLAIDRVMDDVQPGALLALFTAGAYGYVMASNYNARPRPIEIMVDDAKWAVITDRERYEDLVRLEHAVPIWRES
jgi:diaminopimelate decarboxylase